MLFSALVMRYVDLECGKPLQITIIKIAEFKETNPSKDLLCLAQQVGGRQLPPLPPPPASYGSIQVQVVLIGRNSQTSAGVSIYCYLFVLFFCLFCEKSFHSLKISCFLSQIIAIVIEGQNNSGRRRGYRKLETNVEEAMPSMKSANSTYVYQCLCKQNRSKFFRNRK